MLDAADGGKPGARAIAERAAHEHARHAGRLAMAGEGAARLAVLAARSEEERHADARRHKEDDRAEHQVEDGVAATIDHDFERRIPRTPVPSFRSRLLVAYLRATRRKRPYLDPSVLCARIAMERRTVDPAPPRSLRPLRSVVENVVVYTYLPAGEPRTHAFYLHGGSFVFEIAPEHHHFCAALAAALGAKVTVPIYPLAPEHGAAEMQDALAKVYRASGAIDALVGDSAGGGLALALAQREDLAPPRDVVLLSPWLDIALDDPALPAIDAIDPWLSRSGLREAGRLYARELDAKDPRVSPLHGAVEHIERIAVLVGTRDLLLPDARRLRARAPGKVTLLEYEGMVHDFMLVRALPEARRALESIVRILAQ